MGGGGVVFNGRLNRLGLWIGFSVKLCVVFSCGEKALASEPSPNEERLAVSASEDRSFSGSLRIVPVTREQDVVAADIRACVDYARKKYKPTSLGLMGFCYGGGRALEEAAAGESHGVCRARYPSRRSSVVVLEYREKVNKDRTFIFSNIGMTAVKVSITGYKAFMKTTSCCIVGSAFSVRLALTKLLHGQMKDISHSNEISLSPYN